MHLQIPLVNLRQGSIPIGIKPAITGIVVTLIAVQIASPANNFVRVTAKLQISRNGQCYYLPFYYRINSQR